MFFRELVVFGVTPKIWGGGFRGFLGGFWGKSLLLINRTHKSCFSHVGNAKTGFLVKNDAFWGFLGVFLGDQKCAFLRFLEFL